MAKRFLDTNIWDKTWFCDLEPKLKILWLYFCSKCNHAGVLEFNLKAICFFIGEDITLQEIEDYIGSKIIFINKNKIYIPGFIPFQYGCDIQDLNPDSKIHFSIIKIVEKYNLQKFKPYKKPLLRVKDKVKDKVKYKVYLPPAEKLAKAISKTKKVNVNANMNSWAKDFKLLETKDEISRKRIKQVLNWYCVQLKKGLPPYTPEAFSGKSFREKFLRIETAMNKIIGEEKITFKELTTREKKCHDKMEINLETNKGVILDTLPVLVDKLSDNLKETTANIDNIVKDKDTKQLYKDNIFNERIYYTSYSMWIEKEIKAWPGWLGNLDIFSPGNKNFDRYIHITIQKAGIKKTKSLKKLLEN